MRRVVVPFAAMALGLGASASPAIASSSTYRVTTNEKKVAITFDDGPNPALTPFIVAAFAQTGFHATFFMRGDRIDAHTQTASYVASKNNEIANHTFSHRDLVSGGATVAWKEIARCSDRILRLVLGRPPTLFRPPRGNGLENEVVTGIARRQGMRTIGWSVSLDHIYERDHGDRRATLNDLLRRIGPGTIVLAHDGGLHQHAERWLIPRLLDALKRRGYEATTVSDLLRARAS